MRLCSLRMETTVTLCNKVSKYVLLLMFFPKKRGGKGNTRIILIGEVLLFYATGEVRAREEEL